MQKKTGAKLEPKGKATGRLLEKMPRLIRGTESLIIPWYARLGLRQR